MKSTIKKALLASALVPCALSSATSMAHAADLRMSWWGGDSRDVATQEAL